MGAVTAYGVGLGPLWRGLSEGMSAIRPLPTWLGPGLPADLQGALILEGTGDAPRRASTAADEEAWAVTAAREAWEASRFRETLDPRRVGVVFGAMPGFAGGVAVARDLGLRGPVLTVSTACTSSAHALGWALDLIREGDLDAAVVGGVDRVSPEVLAGFLALDVLHPQRCTPFYGRAGTTLGEGAGVLVLARGALASEARTALYGYGWAADGYHETSPHPLGQGTLRAISRALADADCRPDQIDYVSAHGTGTGPNDSSETRALRDVFDPPPPFASQKAHLGHTLAAAGALEAVSTVLSMEGDLHLPTLCEDEAPRAGCVASPLAGKTPHPATTQLALSVNSAFGGISSALVLGRSSPEAPEPDPALKREVDVIGVGLLARGVDGWDVPFVDADRAAPLRELAPRVDPRQLDQGSELLVRCGGLALREGGIRVRGKLREGVGCIIGSRGPSPDSQAAFDASLSERGISGASATAFARIVGHAPSGALSRAFSLLGLASSVLGRETAPLLAILQGHRLLGRRPELEHLLVGGFDVAWPGESPSRGGAGVLVLSSASRSRVRLLADGVAGSLEDAVQKALAQAELRVADIDRVLGDPRLESIFGPRYSTEAGRPTTEPSLTSAGVCVQAVLRIRSGASRRILVGWSESSVAVAIVFEKGKEHES